jgi:hypothetical protein
MRLSSPVDATPLIVPTVTTYDDRQISLFVADLLLTVNFWL